MFLEKFRIKNFRGISDLTLTFNKGLNIIIGENNTGKTRIIDALRICLSYKDNDRNIFVNEKDFTLSSDEIDDMEFTLFFKVDESEEDLFYEIYNPENDYCEIHFKYYIKIKNNRKRIYHKVWGGSFEGNNIPDELFYEFSHIYLDPLRDSSRYLRPGRNNILGKFFSKVEFEDYDKDDLIRDLNEKMNSHGIIDFVNNSKDEYINSHLLEMTHSDFPQFDINLIPNEFDKFVENFFITLPIEGGNLDLSQNGLGYNNLIYMAILLGNLEIESAYTALCVEEPEAHLHPQLQNLFFDYLVSSLYDQYPFQIFMTSHSPILVSHADLDSLIILEKINNEVCAVKWSDLVNNENKSFFKKHFIISKTTLLFSKKVILVEGASERLLLPFFAKIKGFSFEKENIELIDANGNNSIQNYANLFFKSNGNNYLRKKCAILTDNDKKHFDDDCSENALNLLNNYNGDNIGVFLSEKDFEFEIINSNKDKINLLRFLLLDKGIVSNINMTRDFLEKLSNQSYDENLIYDYVNNIKFRKTNLPMKIIYEWDNLEGFKIPDVVDELFEFLED